MFLVLIFVVMLGENMQDPSELKLSSLKWLKHTEFACGIQSTTPHLAAMHPHV
jgi:hypothetical protein